MGKCSKFSDDAVVQFLPAQTPMALPNHSSPSSSSRVEIVIGRSMAACMHPIAAWYALSKPGRVLLAGFYSAVGYVAVLTALLTLF